MSAGKNSPGARKEQGKVVVTRVFDAPRRLVFEAWTSGEHLKNWFAPDGYTVPYATVDFRVGGVWRACQRAANGKEYWGQGVFQEIVRPSRLVFTDTLLGTAEAPRFEMLTIVDFEELGRRQTRMVLEARVIEIYDPRSEPIVMGMGETWRQTLENLALHLVDPSRRRS